MQRPQNNNNNNYNNNNNNNYKRNYNNYRNNNRNEEGDGEQQQYQQKTFSRNYNNNNNRNYNNNNENNNYKPRQYNNNNNNNNNGYYKKPYNKSYNNNNNYNNNKFNNNKQFSSNDIDYDQKPVEFTLKKNFYEEDTVKRSPAEVEKFRKEHEIRIVSRNVEVPNPYFEWDETHFPDFIQQTIKDAKYEHPTAIQTQSHPILMQGHDLIGIAQTGSGKTCAFLLPAIVHIMAQPKVRPGDGPIALVLAPTRELAMQIYEQAQKFGKACNLNSVCIYGGEDKYKQEPYLRQGVDIVIATPGRLIDFIKQDSTNTKRVTYLVLDEADRMLDMGFEPQIREIVKDIRDDRQTVMFSATWPKDIQNLARDLCFNDPVHIQIGHNENSINPNIKQVIDIVDPQEKTDKLIEHLDTMVSDDKVLIFLKTKMDCERICNLLNKEGFDTISLHGDKTQGQRDKAMGQFKKSYKRLMTATDVAARGLDVSDITFVINYDLPQNIEDYIHRIGRTGRAGKKGTAISLFDRQEDFRLARQLTTILQKVNQDYDPELDDFARKNYGKNANKNSYNNRNGGGYNKFNNNNNNRQYNNNNNNNRPFQPRNNEGRPNNNNNFHNNNNNNGGGYKSRFVNSKKSDDQPFYKKWDSNDNNNNNGGNRNYRNYNNNNDNQQQQQGGRNYQNYRNNNNNNKNEDEWN